MLFDGYDIESTGGVDKTVIETAEIELGIKFSDEFIEYLNVYGTVELNSSELFGLGIKGYRNIVRATNKERSLSENFPKNCVVIYNLGINSVLILLCEDGCVYEYTPRSMKKIYDTFNKWILDEFVSY